MIFFIVFHDFSLLFYFFPSHFSLWLPLSLRPSLPADKETENSGTVHTVPLSFSQWSWYVLLGMTGLGIMVVFSTRFLFWAIRKEMGWVLRVAGHL